MVGGPLIAVRVRVSFSPVEEFGVPGFSVRFVKSSLIMADELGLIKSLLLGGGANKPVGLTPVMVGRRALLADGEVVLRPGTTYWVGVGVVGGEDLATYLPDLALKAFDSGVVRCVGVEVNAASLNEAPRGQPRRLVIESLTPIIVRAKGLGGESVFVAAPTLRDLLASPIRVLGRVLWETQGINIPTAWAWRIAKHYAQTHAQTKKVMIRIKQGKPPIPATTGKWEYVATAELPTYLKATLHKALTIAKTLGVGKSRGIGFGQIEIKTQ